MIAAILMGRKGSKGFPGKNLHKVLNHPLAYYPMKAAKGCSEIDKIYLSTDDERLMKLAAENGIEIIKRPPELCTDEALGEHVYVHAYKTVKERTEDIGLRTEGKGQKTEKKEKEIELIVLLMCNAPTITSQTISEGIKILREHPEYDSAVTVSKYNMWSPLRARTIGDDGLLHPFVLFETFGD